MISVSVHNLDRVGRGLRALTDRLKDLSPAWQNVGAAMEEAATPLVPVATGALVDSLKADVGREGVTFTAGGGPVDYAHIQNAGSAVRNIEAKRFMEPAYAVTDRDAAHEIESILTATARLHGLT